MKIAVGSLTPASLVLASAGIIAVSSAISPLPHLEKPTVALIAVDDPLTAWEDVLQTASANATTLYDQWAADPFPALQQVGDNLAGYLANLPGDAGTISTQIVDDLQAAFAAAFEGSTNSFLADAIPALTNYQDLYDFAASPASGVLLGELGTVLSPILALNDSIQDIVSDLSGATPDLTAALDNLLDIPANIADAYLNGQFLDGTSPEIDLGSLISALGVAPYYSVDATLPLGGLLSTDGGSLLSALALSIGYAPPCSDDICFGEFSFQLGGAVGPLAALEVLAQDIAQAITPSSPAAADSLPDLSALLGSDLSTALTNVSAEFTTLTTDLLSLF